MNLSGSWTNSGAITLDNSNLSASGTNWSNSGAVTASNGATIGLSGTWSNSAALVLTNSATLNFSGTGANLGPITETTSTVNIAGSFKTSALGAFAGSGGTFNFSGTLTNDGTLLLPGASTSPIYQLQGATIIGGTISTTGGASLTATQAGGTLDGVTFDGSLVVGQSITIKDGLTLDAGTIAMQGNGSLRFVGTQTLGGSGTFTFNKDSGAGLTVPNAGDTLTIGPGITIHGAGGTVGTSSAGLVDSNGTIASDSGGIITVTGLSNFAAGKLTGGTWQASAGSVLRLIGASITTNAASIVLDGAGSHLYSDAGTTNALAGFVTNAAAGSFKLLNGATLTQSAGTFHNAGVVTVGAGATLATTSFAQTDGSTTLKGGTLGAAPTSIVALSGGTLSGPGTIDASLTNAGALDLGSAPGILSIEGTYTQTAAGTLTLKIGGIAAGTQFDQVSVTGAATLAGTLTTTLANGFAPTAGDSFAVLSFASSSGGFTTFNSPLIPPVGGLPAFAIQITATNVELVGATSAPILAVVPRSIVVTPATALAGQNLSVNFTVQNSGTVLATGPWTDSVYLSTDSTLSADDTLLGRVQHTGNLAGLASDAVKLQRTAPGLDGRLVPRLGRCRQPDAGCPE